MSLSVDGFWKSGFWTQTFWADGFWYEGAVVDSGEITAGGGYPVYLPKRRKKIVRRTVSQMLDMAMQEIYAELTGPVARQESPEITKEAVAIVKSFAKTNKAIPQPAKINWFKLEQDAEKVAQLLALWQEQIALQQEEDDEEELLMQHI